MSAMSPNVCRTCARNVSPLLPLFTPKDPSLASPAAMLLACTRLTIDQKDSLPKTICETCLGRIMDAYSFNAAALRAQKTLSEISKKVVSRPEPCTSKKSPKEQKCTSKKPKEIRILPKNFTLSESANAEKMPTKIIVTSNFQEAIASPESCKICGKTFISAEFLNVHILESHSKPPTAKTCGVCNINFPNSAGLTAHNLEVHFPTRTDDGFSCYICKKAYKHKYILNRHIKKVHGLKKKDFGNFSLNLAPGSLQNSLSVNPQISASPNAESIKLNIKTHFCEFCNRGYVNEKLLSNHISEHSLNGNSFTCGFCDESFSQKKALKEHYNEHHGMTREIYFCGHCKLIHFVNIDEFQKHIKLDHCNIVKSEESNMKIISKIKIETPSPQSPLMPIDLNTNEDNDIISDIETDDKKFIITYYLEEAANNKFDDAIEKLSETTNSSNIITGESNLSLEDIKVLNNKINCDIERKKTVTPTNNLSLLKPDLNYDILQNKESINYILMDITSGDNKTENSDINDIIKNDGLEKDIDSSIVDIFEARCSTENQSKFCTEENTTRKLRKIESDQKYTISIVKPKTIDEITKQKCESDSIIQCEVCNKKFARLFNLQKHMILHKDQPLVCIGCKYSANNLNNLNEHIKKCQLIRKSGNMICKVCGKRLTTAAGYRYHLKSHCQTQRYKCPLCQKCFLTPGYLRIHLKTVHSKERPFSCKSCPRVFATRDHLNKHITATHLIRRDHICHSCGKKFLQRSHLTQHMWIHTGVKPHGCPHCSNEYTSKCSLMKHLQNYHQTVQKEVDKKNQKDDKKLSIMNSENMKFSDIDLNNERTLNEMIDLDNFDVVVVVGEGD